MRLIKNIIVAFSLYSQIPMPRFEGKEDDTKHVIAFLPWIGIVIGLISLGLDYLFSMLELPLICRLALYSLLPLIVTGGFHIDGYMDVQDALKSYKSKEEKLEILKDPHIGAFAVIRLLIYVLVWGAALAVIIDNPDKRFIWAYCIIFFLARAVTAISCLLLKGAKKNGMLNMETSKSSGIDIAMGIVQAILAVTMLAWINIILAAFILFVCLVHMLYYKRLCYKEFGGITGDTAGFSVTTLELWLLLAIAVLSFFI